MTESRENLLVRAADLFRTGPLDAAIDAHRALLAAFPDETNVWYNLSLLERRARRPAKALAALDEALARGIAGPEEVWLQRGVILSDDLGDPDGARAALDRALAIAPDDVAVLLNLGNLEEDLGRRAEAEACYRAALAAAPGHPLVLARQAGVAELAGPGDPLLEMLRGAIEQAGGRSLAQADLGFALGAALDRLGDYDAAFDTYVAANSASRAFAATQGRRYDRVTQERWVDRLIAAAPPPDPEDGPDAPLFVCGMVRSGSTLVERMLERHPALVSGGELDAIPEIARAIVAYPEAVTGLSGEERSALAARYRAETGPRRVDGRTLIDKKPDNILHLHLIRALFPKARIVRTVRGATDNLLSAFFLHADLSLSWATDLGDIAHYLMLERRLAAHARTAQGPLLHEVRYEQLVEKPQDEMAALLAFCGLEWDARVLDPAGGSGTVKTASVWQVREPIHGRSVERWRNYAHRLGDLPARLADLG